MIHVIYLRKLLRYKIGISAIEFLFILFNLYVSLFKEIYFAYEVKNIEMKPSRLREQTLNSLIANFQTTKCSLCWGEIYSRCYPNLFAYCRKLTRNNDDAYDSAIDSFMKASEKIHYLKSAELFPNWLFRIAHNLCMDRIRKNKKERTFSLDDSFDLMDDTSEQELRIEKEALLQKMQSFLDDIEPKNKEILEAKYIHNKSIAEIKTQLGITESALKMRLLRARKKMATMAS